MKNILEVVDLKTYFSGERGVAKAVDGVSFSVGEGEVLGIVGESGSGKSVTALSIMQLVPKPGLVVSGEILFKGEDLVRKSPEAMRRIRAREIAMIFQDPLSSLNPVLTIGKQLTEAMMLHLDFTGRQAQTRAEELLRSVQIPDPKERLSQYPHQLSGGMRQRVMLAMALSCEPRLILADEPTTALDVTVQAQILEMMNTLSRELGVAMVIITHNLGIVARYADNIAVMYAGRVAEYGPTESMFLSPSHPYTIGLLRSVPRPDIMRSERLYMVEGQPPPLTAVPLGCAFHPRCNYSTDRCTQERPDFVDLGGEHQSACFFAEKLGKASLAQAKTGDRA